MILVDQETRLVAVHIAKSRKKELVIAGQCRGDCRSLGTAQMKYYCGSSAYVFPERVHGLPR